MAQTKYYRELLEYVKKILKEEYGIDTEDPASVLEHLAEFREFVYDKLYSVAKKWCEDKKLKDRTCNNAVGRARKELVKKIPATTLDGYSANVTVYKTGIGMLDELFHTKEYGPGIPVAGETSIMFYGQYGTGKTLLAHLFAAAAVAAGYEAHYVDTEMTFKQSLILAFLERFNVSLEEARKRFYLWRVARSKELKNTLIRIRDTMSNGGIVIIDSLSGPIRVEFSGRERFSERGKFLSDIFKLQQDLNRNGYVTLYTAQIYKIPDAGGNTVKYEVLPATTPYGGELLKHQPEWVIATYKVIYHRNIYILLVVDDAPKITGMTCVLRLDPDKIIDSVSEEVAKEVIEKTGIGLFPVKPAKEEKTNNGEKK